MLSRKNSQLFTDILIKIIQRFNFRYTILRAGIEVIAAEVLRRCFLAIESPQIVLRFIELWVLKVSFYGYFWAVFMVVF